ncbi:unnamed protein product [Caenorhabditis auriculariae]|uniref:Uncharacterized protein n=1 Tax=Caenorhabditis auriculariae TaxID=2777116 RepID=A0A8S1HAG6_9PELO|nr:unnamed protein product [Caenorhabditis auriculariae]
MLLAFLLTVLLSHSQCVQQHLQRVDRFCGSPESSDSRFCVHYTRVREARQNPLKEGFAAPIEPVGKPNAVPSDDAALLGVGPLTTPHKAPPAPAQVESNKKVVIIPGATKSVSPMDEAHSDVGGSSLSAVGTPLASQPLASPIDNIGRPSSADLLNVGNKAGSIAGSSGTVENKAAPIVGDSGIVGPISGASDTSLAGVEKQQAPQPLDSPLDVIVKPKVNLATGPAPADETSVVTGLNRPGSNPKTPLAEPIVPVKPGGKIVSDEAALLSSGPLPAAIPNPPTIPVSAGNPASHSTVMVATEKPPIPVVGVGVIDHTPAPLDDPACDKLRTEYDTVCFTSPPLAAFQETRDFCDAFVKNCKHTLMTNLFTELRHLKIDYTAYCKTQKERFRYVCPEPLRFHAYAEQAVEFCIRYNERCPEVKLPSKPVQFKEKDAGHIYTREIEFWCTRTKRTAFNYCTEIDLLKVPKYQLFCGTYKYMCIDILYKRKTVMSLLFGILLVFILHIADGRDYEPVPISKDVDGRAEYRHVPHPVEQELDEPKPRRRHRHRPRLPYDSVYEAQLEEYQRKRDEVNKIRKQMQDRYYEEYFDRMRGYAMQVHIKRYNQLLQQQQSEKERFIKNMKEFGLKTDGIRENTPETPTEPRPLSPFGDAQDKAEVQGGTSSRPRTLRRIDEKSVPLPMKCQRYLPTVRKHCFDGGKTEKEFESRCKGYFHDCQKYLPQADPLYNIAYGFNSNVGINLGTWEVKGIPYYPINEEGAIGATSLINVPFGSWGGGYSDHFGVRDYWSQYHEIGANWYEGKYGYKAGWSVPLVQSLGVEGDTHATVSVPIKPGDVGKPIGVDVGGGVGPYYQQNQHVGVDPYHGQVNTNFGVGVPMAGVGVGLGLGVQFPSIEDITGRG